MHGLVECFNIGLGGLEVAPDPIQPLSARSWWGSDQRDCIEEVEVFPETTETFEWAASDCLDEGGWATPGTASMVRSVRIEYSQPSLKCKSGSGV